MPDRRRSPTSALLATPVLESAWLGRVLAGRRVAGPSVEDAVRLAGELIASGRTVALEHVPGRNDDAAVELAALVRRVRAAGLSRACELSLPVARLGAVAAGEVAAEAAAAGLAVVVIGPDTMVDELRVSFPGARVVVSAADRDAEERCRALADRPVRLVGGRDGAAGNLAFVRCINILMAGGGRPQISTADPRLIAITGERAAWNGRSPDSWEQVMPYGVRVPEQQRLVAAGHPPRVVVPSGRGAVALVSKGLGVRR